MTQPLYSQAVIDHARHPSRTAPLVNPTHQTETVNRSCGDRVSLTLRVTADRIADVGAVSEGCALTTAGGSLLADYLVGKNITDVQSLTEEAILTLAGDISPSPSRRQCLLLAHQALQQALKPPISTSIDETALQA